MDIRFCDICNESVPISDLSEGRAQERSGRVVCVSCDRAMGGGKQAAENPAAPAAVVRAPRHRGSLGSKLALLVFSIAGVAAVSGACWWGFGLQERLDTLEGLAETTGNSSDDLGRQLTQLRADLSEVDDDRAEDSVRLNLQAEEISGTLADIAEQLTRLQEQLRGAGETNTVRFEALTARVEDLRVPPGRMERLEAGLARAEEDLEVLARSVLEGLDRAAPTENVAAAEQPAAPSQPWRVHVEALASPESDLRWDAVEKIGLAGDPEAAPFLTGSLRDEDLFVRMAVARVLGELGSSAAVPALIDALEDEESSVREAAVLSLRVLTGRNFNFEPSADSSGRSRSVSDWRKWWERSGSDVP